MFDVTTTLPVLHADNMENVFLCNAQTISPGWNYDPKLEQFHGKTVSIKWS